MKNNTKTFTGPLILKCWSRDRDYDASEDVAIVELSESLIMDWNLRVSFSSHCKSLNCENLWTMGFVDDSVQLFHTVENVDLSTANQFPSDEEETWAILNNAIEVDCSSLIDNGYTSLEIELDSQMHWANPMQQRRI